MKHDYSETKGWNFVELRVKWAAYPTTPENCNNNHN
jgi:hypothetical protein